MLISNEDKNVLFYLIAGIFILLCFPLILLVLAIDEINKNMKNNGVRTDKNNTSEGIVSSIINIF